MDIEEAGGGGGLRQPLKPNNLPTRLEPASSLVIPIYSWMQVTTTTILLVCMYTCTFFLSLKGKNKGTCLRICLKLVLKDNLCTETQCYQFFFPGSVINTYTNFQRPLPRAVSATSRGSQPHVVRNHLWN